MIPSMLGSRISCRYRSCIYIVKHKMHFISHENYLGVTNLGPFRTDSFIFQSNTSNQIFGSMNPILNRPRQLLSSINSTYFKNLKAFYSNKPTNPEVKKSGNKENDVAKPTKPKKELKTYITLLGVDNSISVSTVEAAKKLADRRNLKLVKVLDFDPKSGRAVYKLVTEAQYLQEDWDDSKSKRGNSNNDDKLVSLSSNTNEHDVHTKVKMIKKWLTKKFEVRVVITGDMVAGENVYKILEREVGNNGRIVQKRGKGSSIRFQILPPKKTEEKAVEK